MGGAAARGPSSRAPSSPASRPARKTRARRRPPPPPPPFRPERDPVRLVAQRRVPPRGGRPRRTRPRRRARRRRRTTGWRRRTRTPPPPSPREATPRPARRPSEPKTPRRRTPSRSTRRKSNRRRPTRRRARASGTGARARGGRRRVAMRLVRLASWVILSDAFVLVAGRRILSDVEASDEVFALATSAGAAWRERDAVDVEPRGGLRQGAVRAAPRPRARERGPEREPLRRDEGGPERTDVFSGRGRRVVARRGVFFTRTPRRTPPRPFADPRRTNPARRVPARDLRLHERVDGELHLPPAVPPVRVPREEDVGEPREVHDQRAVGDSRRGVARLRGDADDRPVVMRTAAVANGSRGEGAGGGGGRRSRVRTPPETGGMNGRRCVGSAAAVVEVAVVVVVRRGEEARGRRPRGRRRALESAWGSSEASWCTVTRYLSRGRPRATSVLARNRSGPRATRRGGGTSRGSSRRPGGGRSRGRCRG